MSFYRQLHEWIHTFPKNDRYTLGIKIQELSLVILEQLLQIQQLPNALKKSHLIQISAKLDLLKLLIRLAHETRCIDQKKYLTLQAMLQEIGKMLGGWIRSVS